MKINFNFLLVVFALVYVGVNSAKLEKKDEKSSVDSINSKTENKHLEEELNGRTLIVEKLSGILKLLSYTFQFIQNKLNFEGIAESDAIESDNILSCFISNPAINSILPSVFETLRAPVTQAIKLIDQIQALLINTDPTDPVNYRMEDLLSQLTDTLNQTSDLLKSDIALRTPGLDFIFDIIMAPLLSLISLFNSLATGVNEVEALPKTVGLQLNEICSKLQNMPAGTEFRTKDLLPLIGLGSKFGAIPDILLFFLKFIFGFGRLGTLSNTNINGARFVIPLKTEKLSNFEQSSYGLIDDDKLVITSVMTTNITDRESKSLDSDLKDRSFFHQMSLYSLQSMMSSLIKDMKDENNKYYLDTLQCQIDGLGCSLREKGNQQNLDNCVNKLSICIGKETSENSKKI